jgi:hypothetical protein
MVPEDKAERGGLPGIRTIIGYLRNLPVEWAVLAMALPLLMLVAHFFPNTIANSNHITWRQWLGSARAYNVCLSDATNLPDLCLITGQPGNNTLWAADTRGRLYSSEDEGETWAINRLKFPPNEPFPGTNSAIEPPWRIRFWDQNIGWFEGRNAVDSFNDGYVFYTTNGGNDWVFLESTYLRPYYNMGTDRYDYWFTGDGRAVCLHGSVLFLSEHDDTNWVKIWGEESDKDDSRYKMWDCAVVATNSKGGIQAWLAATDGTLWHIPEIPKDISMLKSPPLQETNVGEIGAYQMDALGGTFAYGSSTIVDAANSFPANIQISTNTDFGPFFRPNDLHLASALGRSMAMDYSVQFVTAHVGWLLIKNRDIPADSELFRTDNRGTQWTPVRMFANSTATTKNGLSWFPKAMWFVDENKGWLVGNGFAVQRTLDGGKSWYPVVKARSIGLPGWFWVATTLILAIAVWLASRKVPPQKTVREIMEKDSPIEDERSDCFEAAPVAHALASFFQNPETKPPFTVAVTGDWGVGKSSLMMILRRKLAQGGVRTVWFNAWHYQNEESVFPFVLRQVKQDAVPGGIWPSTFLFYVRLVWLRLRRRLWWWMPLAGLLLVLGILSGFYLKNDPGHRNQILSQMALESRPLPKAEPEAANESTTESRTTRTKIGDGKTESSTQKSAVESDQGTSEWLQSIYQAFVAWLTGSLGPVWGIVIAGLAGLLWRVAKPFAARPEEMLVKAASEVRIKDLAGKVSVQSRFQEEFRDVTQALGSKQLVIFIDDLDRCSPVKILEMLEAINFLVSAGDCFVVLGFSRRQVEAGLALAFEETALEMVLTNRELALAGEIKDDVKKRRFAMARLYLRKLIQLETRVPKATPGQLAKKIRAGQPESNNGNSAKSNGTAWVDVFFGAVDWLWDRKSGVLLTLVCLAGGLLGAFLPAKYDHPTEPPAPPPLVMVTGQSIPSSNYLARRNGDIAPSNLPVLNLQTATTNPVPWPAVSPVPVTSTTMWSVWFHVAICSAVLALFLVVLWIAIQRAVARQYEDSDAFQKALFSWVDEWTAANETPREALRFINRMRYLTYRSKGVITTHTKEEILKKAVSQVLKRIKNPGTKNPPPDPQAEEKPSGNGLNDADVVAFYCHAAAGNLWKAPKDTQKISKLKEKWTLHWGSRELSAPMAAYARLAAEIGEETGTQAEGQSNDPA